LYEVEFEGTKGVIRIHKSKKVGQQNGKKKNDKRKNNDLQNSKQKTKHRATRTPTKKPGRTHVLRKGKQFLLH